MQPTPQSTTDFKIPRLALELGQRNRAMETMIGLQAMGLDNSHIGALAYAAAMGCTSTRVMKAADGVTPSALEATRYVVRTPDIEATVLRAVRGPDPTSEHPTPADVKRLARVINVAKRHDLTIDTATLVAEADTRLRDLRMMRDAVAQAKDLTRQASRGSGLSR